MHLRRLDCFISISVVLLLRALLPQPALAQTYQVVHNFTGGGDGGGPAAGLTVDQAGNLYGTTELGGSGCGGDGCGTVFKLAYKNSAWVLTTLYTFGGGTDGANPASRVIFGPDGALYGTAAGGNSACSGGCGIVFSLRPPATFCRAIRCPWTKTLLYQFSGTSDGAFPSGDLTFDQAGNIYGTTLEGGIVSCDAQTVGCGVVYKLSHSGSGWTESVIYNFQGGTDGQYPTGVIFGNDGNLYGTASGGPYQQCVGFGGGCGLVYQLAHSGTGWTQSIIYDFQGPTDGGFPSPVISDSAGNLYGGTLVGGSGSGGTAYQLSPSGGNWILALLHAFPYDPPVPPGGPGTLTIDPGGNLYGATLQDGNGLGSIFKLAASNNNWIFTELHDFSGPDGVYPNSPVSLDGHGDLFGTTNIGGVYGPGVLWEITGLDSMPTRP